MNPETRTILKVELEDAVAADEILQSLWEIRWNHAREFIQAHAKMVSNLDI